MSRHINLPGGERVIVDDCDYERLTAYRWYISKSPRGYKYATSTIDGKWIGMHRFIVGARPGMVVDHINGDGLDNRRENLRECTAAQNKANSRRALGRSLPKGVYFVPNKPKPYRVQVRSNKVCHSAGYFACLGDAVKAHRSLSSKLHGEYAKSEGAAL